MMTKPFCILALVVLLAGGCQPFPRPPEADILTATQPLTIPEPTVSLTETRSLPPTYTPRPTLTPSPTPELFDCLPPGEEVNRAAVSIQILYVNENNVWLWDERTGEKTLLQLPEDAVAPHLSPDGRYIAFLTEGRQISMAGRPLEAIPLRILDRLNNTVLQVGEFSPRTTHHLYPEAERVYLQWMWEISSQPGGVVEGLQVLVFAEAWGVGTESTVGERYRVSLPDGSIALLEDTSAPYETSLSPDARFTVSPHPQGLSLVDRQSGFEKMIPLEPACPNSEVCYLSGGRQLIWRVDSSGFYTLAAKNAYFDERAETTLYFVQVQPAVIVEELALLRANPATFSFSPDRRFLSFWNQPDVDHAPPKTYNWVTLSLLDLQTLAIRRYAQGWVLRLADWNPDSRRFLLTSSPFGGPNPIVKRLMLGNTCHPPEELAVPPKQIIMETRWLDDQRALMWTAPEDGIPDRYPAGMFLYNLGVGNEPLKIDDLVQDSTQPYGVRRDFVLLNGAGGLP